MGRRNKILVPEARQALDQLKAKIMNTKNPNDAKFEAAEEQGISLNEGYNGNIKAKDAGNIGGKIGGQMVKEMIKMAEQQLNKNQ
jgi:small acid-soluble spore protein D (minor alpha/beta-type SASP)